MNYLQVIQNHTHLEPTHCGSIAIDNLTRPVLFNAQYTRKHCGRVLTRTWKWEPLCDRFLHLSQLSTQELLKTTEFQESGNRLTVPQFREYCTQVICRLEWVAIDRIDFPEPIA